MRENSNLARAFEEHTIRTLGYVDEIVIAIQKQYEVKGRNFDLQTFYREMRPNLEVLRNVVITDEKGMIIMGTAQSPRISLADREHVTVHSGAPTNFLYISKPMLARINKQWSIIATRRASKPDGSFAGVVGVAINPEYFSNFYRDVELGSQGVVSLIGTDGVVRARLSSNGAQIGRELQHSKVFVDTSTVPKSSYVARSALDGIERIYSSRQVHGYPLVVYVGTSVAESLAQVVTQEGDSRLTLAVATVIIVLFAIGLLLLNMRRTRAQTLLRESELRFRSLMKLSSDWYWEQDENYCFIDHKFAVAPDVEFREAPPVFGKTRWEIHSRSLTPNQWAEHRGQLEARLEFRDLEFERPSRDGKLRWVSVSGMPIFGEDGSFRGYRGTGKDITERKQAAAANAALEAQLRESQKMETIGTLAGGIAHDFNNMIASILGNAELAYMDAGTSPGAVRQSVDEIRKAGRRAREMVKQILSFSRRHPTELKPIALAPVVREAARLLRATLLAPVTIDVRCDADVPLVLADNTQIEQIVFNLATNAAQAIGGIPGRIEIRVDTVLLDRAKVTAHPELHALHERHPGRTVRLMISDDGPGMDATTRAKIFEPFFTTKPVGEGTGLGLSVVHGIVQAHEGAIIVDSTLGKGTTFTLYLPVAPLDARRHGECGQFATPATPALTLGGRRHILYLDDDEALVDLVTRLLERNGYRVSSYIDQSAALAVLRADPSSFDLVVTDFNMPGMSGLDVAREVKLIRADLPVVVVSGFIDEVLQTQAAAVGVREVICKATAVEDLSAVIARLAQTIGAKTGSA
jgi:PAS domain S-box-containing protein